MRSLKVLPEWGVGHIRAECERHLSPAPSLDHRLIRAAHTPHGVVKVVPGQSSPLRKMKRPSIVQDVGPQGCVGGGDGGGQLTPSGHHRLCGGDQGGPSLRDPQLLQVQGGDSLAPALHLLQHPEKRVIGDLSNEKQYCWYLVVRLVVGDRGLKRRNRVE